MRVIGISLNDSTGGESGGASSGSATTFQGKVQDLGDKLYVEYGTFVGAKTSSLSQDISSTRKEHNERWRNSCF